MSIYRTHVDLTKKETEALLKFAQEYSSRVGINPVSDESIAISKLGKALLDQSKFYEW